jgi:hypothetical protein
MEPYAAAISREIDCRLTVRILARTAATASSCPVAWDPASVAVIDPATNGAASCDREDVREKMFAVVAKPRSATLSDALERDGPLWVSPLGNSLVILVWALIVQRPSAS